MTEVTLAQIRGLVQDAIGAGNESETQKGRRRLLQVVDDLGAVGSGDDDAPLLDGRTWRIAEVRVAGLGGIGTLARSPVTFAPVPGLTVVRGLNGQGKTSLARGIDVALRGEHDAATEVVGSLWETELLTDGSETGTAELALLSGADRLDLAITFASSSAQPQVSATLTDESGSRSVELSGAWRRVLAGARACYSYAALQSRLVERKNLQSFLEELLLLGPQWERVRTEVDRRAAETAAASKAFETARKNARDREAALTARFADDPREPRRPDPVTWPGAKDGIEVDAWLAGTGLSDGTRRNPIEVAADHEDRIARLRTDLSTADEELRTAEHGLDTPGMAAALHHVEQIVAVDELDGSRCPLCGSETDWRGQAAAITRSLRDRRDAADRVRRAVEAVRDWTGTELVPLLDVGIPGAPESELAAFRSVTGLGCHAHSAAHGRAVTLLHRLADDQHSAWLSAIRATTSATAEWRAELATVVHEFAAAIRDVTMSAADAGPWKKAQEALDRLQLDLRQSRQDVVTDQLQTALARLLPDAAVKIAKIEHRGGAKKQHGVVVELEIAGREAKLGMLSSGQRNALLLAPLVMTDAPGPFGFVVVDDPVHALDDTRVDLLACELTRLACERQVIVLTHDPRLEEHLRARHPDTTVVELDRDPASQVVSWSEHTSPWRSLLTDARRIHEHAAGDNWHYTEDVHSVLAGMCRAAVDGAIRQAVITRAARRGENVEKALTDLEEARNTRYRIDHVFGLAGGKERLPDLVRGKKSYLGFWNKGSHGQLPDGTGVLNAIAAAEAACQELSDHDWTER